VNTPLKIERQAEPSASDLPAAQPTDAPTAEP
jgi:hypothetical protein